VEGSGRGLREILFCHLPGGLKEYHEKSRVRVAGDPAPDSNRAYPEYES
jgi:hypothetical protein